MECVCQSASFIFEISHQISVKFFTDGLLENLAFEFNYFLESSEAEYMFFVRDMVAFLTTTTLQELLGTLKTGQHVFCLFVKLRRSM